PGTLALVYSEPEGLKTWLELVVCLEAIRRGRKVVWLDFEMSGRAIAARLADLGATEEEIQRFLYVQPEEPLTTAGARNGADAPMQHEPAVVVIDAMQGALALHGLNGDKAEDVERLYSILLKPFRVGDAAIRVIDHVTKDKETRGRWPIGSQRKLGA